MAYGDLSRIRTNIGAFSALNTMNVINKALAKAQLQLATGKRINSAGDDPAGYSIAKELEGKALRFGQNLNNIGDAKNVLYTAESGLTSMKDILTQMSVKTVQAASDTLGDMDRDKIAVELIQLALEIDQIVDQTQWRDLKLLDGSYSDKTIWVGPEEDKTENSMKLTISTDPLKSADLLVGVSTSGAPGVATFWAGFGASTLGISGPPDWTAAWATMNATQLGCTPAIYADYTEFATGHYVASITRLVGAAGTITINLWDVDNATWVKMEGDSSTNDTVGTLSYTMEIVGAGAAAYQINTGRGLAFTVTAGALATSADIAFTHSGHSVSDSDKAATYLAAIKDALDKVDDIITDVGAYEMRLNEKENRVASQETDVWTAYSRIMDADMAKTQLDVTKYTILQQSAVAGLAQANVAPSFILGLLGG